MRSSPALPVLFDKKRMIYLRLMVLTAPSPITPPDEWAAANRIYGQDKGIPGPRDVGLTPYIIPFERAVVSGKYKRIVLVTAAQSGKTEGMLDLIGQRLDQRPAPILYVGPSKQFLREQFEPRVMTLIEEAATLSAKIGSEKRMTQTRKIIAGVPLRLAHAGSSTALKSDPAALALVDEYDDMLKNVKGQGDPLGLVERRGDTYADFVCAVASTPGKGSVEAVTDANSGLAFWDTAAAEDVESRIWALWQQGSRHHWAWPCPHCKEYFIPRFDCLSYPDGASPMRAAQATTMICPRCGGVLVEADKAAMNERGRYVAPGQRIDAAGNVTGEPPEASALSLWVSGLASPFVTWGERVQSYLEAVAMADDAAIQTAVCSGFGELHSPGGINVREWQQVARLRDGRRASEVPDEVLRLSCAVDVSGSTLWYSIRGWGGRATSWMIEYGELAGFTDEQEVWTDLSALLHDTYGGMHIALALIDSGFRPNKVSEGSANMVYEFCRRFPRFVKPTKGFATLTAPIMRSKTKVVIPGRGISARLDLVRLDTDFWKSRVYERLAWPEHQAGAFHLHGNATEDYCRQLVSEVRQVTPTGRPQWVQLSRRNHYFDCEAMNEAAGHLLNVQKIPASARRVASDKVAADEPAPVPAVSAAALAKKRMADIAARMNREHR